MPELYQYPIPRNEGVLAGEWNAEDQGWGIGAHGGDLSHTDGGYFCVGVWCDKGAFSTYWRSHVFKLDPIRFPRGGFITNIQLGARSSIGWGFQGQTWMDFVLYKMVGAGLSEQVRVPFPLTNQGAFEKITYDLLAPYDVSDWTDGFKLCINTGVNANVPAAMGETHAVTVKVYAVPKYRLIVNVRTPTNTPAAGALVNVLWADTGEYVTTVSSDSNGQVIVDLLAGKYQLAITHSTGGTSGISVDLKADSITIPITLTSGSNFFVTVKAITPDNIPVYGKTITLDAAPAKTEAHFSASGGNHLLTAEPNGFISWSDGETSNSRLIGLTGNDATFTAIYESIIIGDGLPIPGLAIMAALSVLGLVSVGIFVIARRRKK